MHKSLSLLMSALLSSGAVHSVSAAPSNFDANLYNPAAHGARTRDIIETLPEAVRARKLATQRSLPNYRGYPSHFDKRQGGATFLWLDRAAQSARMTPLKMSLQPEAIARGALEKQSALLGVSKTSVAEARLEDLHDTGKGPLIARFKQFQNGVEVFGRGMSVMLDRALTPVAVSGYFAPGENAAATTAARSSGSEFVLGDVDAIAAAYADLGQEPLQQNLHKLADRHGYAVYQAQGKGGNWHLGEEPRTKRVYFPQGDGVEAAYYVEVALSENTGHEERRYGYVISARDGRVLFRKNQTADLAVSYRVWADASGKHQPFDSPLGNALAPVPSLDPNAVIARVPAATNLVTLESGPISTGDPWLIAGQNDTFGNNVEAYLDLGSIDGLQPEAGDMRAPMSSAGAFDYDVHADSDPSDPVSRLGAVVNLFYLNNWMHDDWYDNGFNEKAGNAQYDNYGRGGVDKDPIKAEGQDNSGRNNANMSTPSDGARPRMQMYLFDGPAVGELRVTQPDLGTLGFGVAAFEPYAFDITGDVVLVDDGVVGSVDGKTGTTSDGCETPFVNAGALAGKIALIDRGLCNFTDKVANAQAAGAIGVILANNAVNGEAIALGGVDPGNLSIGVLSVSTADGARLKDALAQGQVTAHLRRDLSLARDGTLDIGIIAHEFFHYVSNRLVFDGYGLVNPQAGAMGEGWSDFNTLLMSVREEDRLLPGNEHYQGAYSTGTYVDENVYYGIRRTPYSTDLAINPLTFKHIENGVALPDSAPIASGKDGANNAEVHASGEIWANVLWEVYAALLNDPRYSFAQARERMQDYIIAGLKMTPYAPTYLEARDALLAAIAATDEQDFELAAKAFAKRGMGVGAVAPDRGDIDNSGVVESFVALAGAFDVVSAKFDYGYDDGTEGYCSNNNGLDVGETAKLTVTIRSYGTRALTEPVVAQLSSDGDVSFAGDGKLVFTAPLKPGDEATASTTFKLNSATTAQSLKFTLSFPEMGESADAVLEPASTTTRTQYVNFDAVPNSVSDDVENPAAASRDWSRTDVESSADWQIDSLDGINHFWYGPNNSTTSNPVLTTRPIVVADAGDFSVSFDHWFQFEYAGELGGVQYGFDGGYVEISVDGGAWDNVTAMGGTFTEGGYTGIIAAPLPILEEEAFVGQLNPDETFAHSVLSFGDSLAGHTVRLRFHVQSDSVVGDIGWMVDNIAFSGASSMPFSRVAPVSGQCDAHVPHAYAGDDFTVRKTDVQGKPTKVHLSGHGADRDAGDTISLKWVQTAGPAVVLENVTSDTPSFEAPDVSEDTALTFRLQVSDGVSSDEDSVVVTVRNNHAPIAKAGEDVSVDETDAAGKPTVVQLTGSASDEDAGDSLSYVWTQTGGPAVTLSGADSASASFAAPDVSATTPLTFQLQVSDGASQATDSVVVSVRPVQKGSTGGNTGSGGGGGGSSGPFGLLLLALGQIARRALKR